MGRRTPGLLSGLFVALIAILAQGGWSPPAIQGAPVCSRQPDRW